MRPPLTLMSASPANPCGNVSTVAPFISIPSATATPQDIVEDRHPHGHARGDLSRDDRFDFVSDARGDLHPAVHRPGCMTSGLRFNLFQRVCVSPYCSVYSRSDGNRDWLTRSIWILSR